MNSEEGMHLNSFRYGVDGRVSQELKNELTSPNKKYNGKFECEDAAPKVTDCIERGAEVSHWISERLINIDSFCDYTTGNCQSLFV